MTTSKRGGDHSEEHTKLVNDVMVALGNEPDLAVWKFRPGGELNMAGIPVFCAPKGIADICGILAPFGTWIALECKTGDAQLNQWQREWAPLMVSFGGYFGIVRSVDDALQHVANARAQRDNRIDYMADMLGPKMDWLAWQRFEDEQGVFDAWGSVPRNIADEARKLRAARINAHVNGPPKRRRTRRSKP